jgi:hypothetical protein
MHAHHSSAAIDSRIPTLLYSPLPTNASPALLQQELPPPPCPGPRITHEDHTFTAWVAGAGRSLSGKDYVDRMIAAGEPSSTLISFVGGQVYYYAPAHRDMPFLTNLVDWMVYHINRSCQAREGRGGVGPLQPFELPLVTVADPMLLPEAIRLQFSGHYAYCASSPSAGGAAYTGLSPIPRPYMWLQDTGAADTAAWKDKLPKAVFMGSLSSVERLDLYRRWAGSMRLQQLLYVGITKVPGGAAAVDRCGARYW